MKLTTAPVTKAITVTEAKTHLRIASGNTSFDTEIGDLIDSAQVMMLHEVSVLPAAGVVTFYAPDFDNIILDVYSIASIVVKYYDSANSLQTLDAGSYKFYANDYPYSLEVTTTPALYDRGDAVQVECTTADLTDPMVKQALKMMVADMFENKQTDNIGALSKFSRATDYQLSLISKRIEI